MAVEQRFASPLPPVDPLCIYIIWWAGDDGLTRSSICKGADVNKCVAGPRASCEGGVPQNFVRITPPDPIHEGRHYWVSQKTPRFSTWGNKVKGYVEYRRPICGPHLAGLFVNEQLGCAWDRFEWYTGHVVQHERLECDVCDWGKLCWCGSAWRKAVYVLSHDLKRKGLVYRSGPATVDKEGRIIVMMDDRGQRIRLVPDPTSRGSGC